MAHHCCYILLFWGVLCCLVATSGRSLLLPTIGAHLRQPQMAKVRDEQFPMWNRIRLNDVQVTSWTTPFQRPMQSRAAPTSHAAFRFSNFGLAWIPHGLMLSMFACIMGLAHHSWRHGLLRHFCCADRNRHEFRPGGNVWHMVMLNELGHQGQALSKMELADGPVQSTRRTGIAPGVPYAETQNRVPSNFAGMDIAFDKIGKPIPPVLSPPPDDLKQRMRFLQLLTGNAQALANKCPLVLNLSRYEMAKVVQTLQNLGLDAQRVLRNCPVLFLRDPRSVVAVVAVLKSAKVDVVCCVHHHPAILCNNPKSLEEKVRWLQSQGVEVSKVFLRRSRVIRCDMQRFEEVAAFLKALGVDIPKVLGNAPLILKRPVAALEEIVSFLQANGLNVSKLVNGYPPLLSSNLNGKIQPIVDYLLHEKGYPPAEIDNFPVCLSYSLENRIQPRLEYLQLKGRTSVTLAYVLTLTEKKFVLMAGGTFDEYERWRQGPLDCAIKKLRLLESCHDSEGQKG